MRKTTSGFTIVELIVVIVVVAILATLAAASYTASQATARDTKRKSDLSNIAEAVQLYRQKYGNDVITSPTGTTCGSAGNGWFNYATGSSGAYQYSTLSCLQGAGHLDGGGQFVDPSGCTTNGGAFAGSTGPCKKYDNIYPAYMKYTIGSGDSSVTCLYAHLETEDNSAVLTSPSNNPCFGASATSGNSSAFLSNNYKMNYMLIVR